MRLPAQDKKDKPFGGRLGWSLIRSSYLFRSQWFNLRKDVLARGKVKGTYTYIEHPGSVFVVPITPEHRILLIRSYRFTIDTCCWEVPAGSMGDRTGLTPEAVAAIELAEEAGAKCRKMVALGKYYLGNGYASHCGHFFLGLNAQVLAQAKYDALEHVSAVKPFAVAEIRNLIHEGGISDGDSAFALLLAIDFLQTETLPSATSKKRTRLTHHEARRRS